MIPHTDPISSHVHQAFLCTHTHTCTWAEQRAGGSILRRAGHDPASKCRAPSQQLSRRKARGMLLYNSDPTTAQRRGTEDGRPYRFARIDGMPITVTHSRQGGDRPVKREHVSARTRPFKCTDGVTGPSLPYQCPGPTVRCTDGVTGPSTQYWWCPGPAVRCTNGVTRPPHRS